MFPNQVVAINGDPRQIGDVWHSSYWNQNYTILERIGEWFMVQWQDGSVTVHCTKLDKRDYIVSGS